MQQPAMSATELDDYILAEIEDQGAMTAGHVRKLTSEEPRDIEKSLARLVLMGDLTWIPGLPRQGVFFTFAENRAEFGLPLRSRAGHGPKGFTKRSTHQRLSELRDMLEAYDDITIDELASELRWNRESVRRYLLRLQDRGEVVSHPLHSPTRGRPPTGWSLDRENWAEVDFSNVAEGP